MNRRPLVIFVLIALASLLIYLLWPSDERRIRKLFNEGAKAIEEERIDDVMAKVSYNFSDKRGLSYLTLKQAMTRLFQQFEGIRIEYEILDLQVEGETARAKVAVRVIATQGKDTGYFVGDAARPDEMIFTLGKERARWLVTKSEGLRFYSKTYPPTTTVMKWLNTS